MIAPRLAWPRAGLAAPLALLLAHRVLSRRPRLPPTLARASLALASLRPAPSLAPTVLSSQRYPSRARSVWCQHAGALPMGSGRHSHCGAHCRLRSCSPRGGNLLPLPGRLYHAQRSRHRLPHPSRLAAHAGAVSGVAVHLPLLHPPWHRCCHTPLLNGPQRIWPLAAAAVGAAGEMKGHMIVACMLCACEMRRACMLAAIARSQLPPQKFRVGSASHSRHTRRPLVWFHTPGASSSCKAPHPLECCPSCIAIGHRKFVGHGSCSEAGEWCAGRPLDRCVRRPRRKNIL